MYDKLIKNIKPIVISIGSAGLITSIYLSAAQYQEINNPVRNYSLIIHGKGARDFPSNLPDSIDEKISDCLHSSPVYECLNAARRNNGSNNGVFTVEIK